MFVFTTDKRFLSFLNLQQNTEVKKIEVVLLSLRTFLSTDNSCLFTLGISFTLHVIFFFFLWAQDLSLYTWIFSLTLHINVLCLG